MRVTISATGATALDETYTILSHDRERRASTGRSRRDLGFGGSYSLGAQRDGGPARRRRRARDGDAVVRGGLEIGEASRAARLRQRRGKKRWRARRRSGSMSCRRARGATPGYDAIVCVDVLLSATTIVTARGPGPARDGRGRPGARRGARRGPEGRAAAHRRALEPRRRRALRRARRRSPPRPGTAPLVHVSPFAGDAGGGRAARARLRGVPAQLRGDRQRARAAAPPRGADRRGRGRRGVRRGPDGDGVARAADAGPRLRPRGPPHRRRGEALGRRPTWR